jgi:uncharacterized membrane protein
MEAWLEIATRNASLAIKAIALLVIVVGTIEAVIGGIRFMLSAARSGHERRAVWIHYARWLVAGLTFQLASDIVETATAPSWDAIGRLGAIAAIRTFLNYFLERDVAEIREREEKSERAAR